MPYRAGMMMKNALSYSVAIGIAAGAAATAVSTVMGFQRAKKLSAEPTPEDMLKAAGAAIQNQAGVVYPLRLIAPRNSTLDVATRKQLKKRFGAYGMAQVCAAYEDAYFSREDMKYLQKTGFNSILLDINPTALYAKGKQTKAPDFERLDAKLAFCRKYKFTAVIRLADTLFFEDKEKVEKNALAMWAALAEHCREDATVAAYVIGPRALAEGEKALRASRYYQDVIKTVRKVDTAHLLLAEQTDGVNSAELVSKVANCGTLAFYGNVCDSLPAFPTAACPQVVCFCSHDALPQGNAESLAGFGYESYKSLTADCGLIRRYAYQTDFEKTAYEDLLTEIKAEWSNEPYIPYEPVAESLAPWLQPTESPCQGEQSGSAPFLTLGVRYSTKQNQITFQKGAKQEEPASEQPDENE